ncbi:unnamed protein product [Heligmosomoides polygyrus]|uniref:Uncharacterized protein n=1 Tax=Heligmosomoides polygyrus TaxID=6339 RepID=A0A3P8E8J6_HELPZ|nr:unnamed protein product [Heligmosomoides polygyrus]
MCSVLRVFDQGRVRHPKQKRVHWAEIGLKSLGNVTVETPLGSNSSLLEPRWNESQCQNVLQEVSMLISLNRTLIVRAELSSIVYSNLTTQNYSAFSQTFTVKFENVLDPAEGEKKRGYERGEKIYALKVETEAPFLFAVPLPGVCGEGSMVPVRFLVNTTSACTIRVERYDDRLMKIVVAAKERLYHFFSAYAPQAIRSDQAKEQFWSLLYEKTADVPTKDGVVVAGNLIGHAGATKNGYSCHGGFGYGSRNGDATDAIRQAAQSELGITKPGRRNVDKQTWLWTDDVKAKVREKKSLYHEFLGGKTADNRRMYQEAEEATEKAVAVAKTTHYGDVNEKLASRDGERYLYRLAMNRHRWTEDVEKFFGVNDEDGHLFIDRKKALKYWRDYFKEISTAEFPHPAIPSTAPTHSPVQRITVEKT